MFIVITPCGTLAPERANISPFQNSLLSEAARSIARYCSGVSLAFVAVSIGVLLRDYASGGPGRRGCPKRPGSGGSTDLSGIAALSFASATIGGIGTPDPP
jgi:hypothetical protein